MKYRFLFLLILSFSLSATCQTDNPKFEKLLADSLGADDYGMKSYILVILKTGPKKIEDKKVLDSLFKGHMDNISVMASNGKLSFSFFCAGAVEIHNIQMHVIASLRLIINND